MPNKNESAPHDFYGPSASFSQCVKNKNLLSLDKYENSVKSTFPAIKTVWKFHDFFIIQIFREITFGDYRSAKSDNLTHLEALNFDFMQFTYHFLKAEIDQINKIRSP